MGSQVLETARLIALTGVAVLVNSVGVAASEPSPTPTPRPAGGQSLTEVAKDKKLKGDTKDTSGGSIVISNENLADYASKGGLTTASPGTQKKLGRSVHAGPGVKVVDSETAQTEERMRYWQERYRQQLERIAAIKRQIEKLNFQIPGLWRDFYSRDDPAYRDGVIKPTLDRSLEQRDRLEAQLLLEQPKLDKIKVEARQDGAEPGWFRAIKEPTPIPKKPTPDIVIR